ncbi:carotenoid-cleaving dioxygenase, mitochondrial-like [Saccoglossus kowalevskii]|uniref:Beta,beta-carotene 9',10'-oxygenase-like n=1 Tax=Saccoglossus kowalevskii TaxID=10224 RepID=A0ABM0MUF3_SACKO|nr:PREDICTED: beta,beta-carotene 9',10'-oxygenase-like [Saccoglossus kowalevskii]
MGTKYGLYSSYNIIKVPPPDKGVQDNPLQKASIVCTIPMSNKHPSYYHSFGMTDNYFIYVEQPLILNIWKLVIMKIMGYTFADCMEFHKDWPTRIHLCNRETSQLTEIKYIADALFLFHHVNAYEDNGHMVIDIFAYEDDLIMKRMYMKVAQDGHDLPLSRPYRFVLPLYIPKNTKVGVNLVTLDNCQATAMLREDGSVYCHHELLFDPNIIAEFPRINYDDCNGKKYRYFYSSGRDLMQLLKYDLEKRTIKAWKEDDMFGSEPVFIAKPGATKEDEGVVISSVLSGDEKKSSFLLILDGESFEEIGRAVTPAHVQNSFGGHGLFDFTIN